MALAKLLSRGEITDACRRLRHVEAEQTSSDLSALERAAVAIGAADARQGKRIATNPHGRLQRLTAMVAGRRTPATLADPRLDALRRFAQVAATGRERIADLRRARDAGFNPGQIVLAARLSRGIARPVPL